MKKLRVAFFLLVSICYFAGVASAADNYTSLRGKTDIPASSNQPVGIDWQAKDASIDRTFVHQPPLIPHGVNDYNITTSQNDCLDCHGEKDSDAPMPHKSHFMDRDNKKTETVSSRWYFCSQCHVGQVEASPLVENTFQAK